MVLRFGKPPLQTLTKSRIDSRAHARDLI
jgi:hypothetical protein